MLLYWLCCSPCWNQGKMTKSKGCASWIHFPFYWGCLRAQHQQLLPPAPQPLVGDAEDGNHPPTSNSLSLRHLPPWRRRLMSSLRREPEHCSMHRLFPPPLLRCLALPGCHGNDHKRCRGNKEMETRGGGKIEIPGSFQQGKAAFDKQAIYFRGCCCCSGIRGRRGWVRISHPRRSEKGRKDTSYVLLTGNFFLSAVWSLVSE